MYKRQEFPQSGLQARVSVRFYLQDGYTAPPVVEDEAVDTDSPAYSQMIERSLMQTGNMSRIAAAIHKAKQGEDVTLAYIGGSITPVSYTHLIPSLMPYFYTQGYFAMQNVLHYS